MFRAVRLEMKVSNTRLKRHCRLKQQGLPSMKHVLCLALAHNCSGSFFFQSFTLKIAREYKFLFYEMKSRNTEL